jgi:hypothetical protein
VKHTNQAQGRGDETWRERLSSAEYDDESEDMKELSSEGEGGSFSLKGQWL